MILDGKIVAEKRRIMLKEEIDRAVAKGIRAPHLVIITVGDDPASKTYVRNKIKACEEIGIIVRHYCFAADDEPRAVLDLIRTLNNAPRINGIMVQLPLPEGWYERQIIDAINPQKDVDGLTTTNIGKLRSGQLCIEPCTAAGVIDLLDYYDIRLDGKDVTIVGRSNIVGKPLADMMMQRGATVTQCHSCTNDLLFHTITADILISAVGKPKFITDNMIKYGATVIDVGIHRDNNGKLCGDVDYENVSEKTNHITPVPGGVGPMTVAMLLRNTVFCWRKQNEI